MLAAQDPPPGPGEMSSYNTIIGRCPAMSQRPNGLVAQSALSAETPTSVGLSLFAHAHYNYANGGRKTATAQKPKAHFSKTFCRTHHGELAPVRRRAEL